LTFFGLFWPLSFYVDLTDLKMITAEFWALSDIKTLILDTEW